MGFALWGRRAPSIRARLTGIFAVSISTLVLLGGVGLMYQSRRTAEKRAHEILQLTIERARAELREQEDEPHTLLNFAQEEQGELAVGNVGIVVVDNQGHDLWRSRSHLPNWPPNKSERLHWRFKTITEGQQTMVLALPWTEIADELYEREITFATLGLLLIFASTLGAWMLVGHTLTPIDRLSQQAQNASAAALHVRLQPPSPDVEVVRLVGTLNGLLERLEGEVAVRGRFYASASHELRTPLQALIGELDVALSRPRSEEEYKLALETVQGQSLRLMNLIQELLQLNHVEMTKGAPPSKTNLADITERCLLPLASLIESHQLKVESSLPDAEILAPTAHVEMLVRNLMENAIKYATPHGRVRVALTSNKHCTQLAIWNSAVIDESIDTDLWFEPFYRPDDARTASTGGNGLGLAICRAIAQKNGWELVLCPHEQGICACVQWPRGTNINEAPLVCGCFTDC